MTRAITPELARALATLARELDHGRWSEALVSARLALELGHDEPRELLELVTAVASLAVSLDDRAKAPPPILRVSLTRSSSPDDASSVAVTLRVPASVHVSPDAGPGIDLAIIKGA